MLKADLRVNNKIAITAIQFQILHNLIKQKFYKFQTELSDGNWISIATGNVKTSNEKHIFHPICLLYEHTATR